MNCLTLEYLLEKIFSFDEAINRHKTCAIQYHNNTNKLYITVYNFQSIDIILIALSLHNSI